MELCIYNYPSRKSIAAECGHVDWCAQQPCIINKPTELLRHEQISNFLLTMSIATVPSFIVTSDQDNIHFLQNGF